MRVKTFSANFHFCVNYSFNNVWYFRVDFTGNCILYLFLALIPRTKTTEDLSVLFCLWLQDNQPSLHEDSDYIYKQHFVLVNNFGFRGQKNNRWCFQHRNDCIEHTVSGTKSIFVCGLGEQFCVFFSMKQSQIRMIYISTSAEGHVRPQRSLYVASFPLVLYHLSHMFFLSSKERIRVKRMLLFCLLKGFILFCLIKRGGKLQAALQWSLS